MWAAIVTHPFLAACWAALFLGLGVEIGIYLEMSFHEADRRAARRLSSCPSCGEATQDGYCANCHDLPAPDPDLAFLCSVGLTHEVPGRSGQ